MHGEKNNQIIVEIEPSSSYHTGIIRKVILEKKLSN